MVPVVDLLFLKRDKQQGRQFIEQLSDGVDAHGQLHRRLFLRLQGEVVLAIEVDRRCACNAVADQGICQRFEVPWPGDDALVVEGPGGCYHHRQSRVDRQ
ncbi:hypothetical protein D3C85_1457330 [compost metagenome]